VAEQNSVWNKTWQYTLLERKENYSADKVGFLYASPPPLSETRKIETRKVES